MDRIFVPLYIFFEKHKFLMYALLIVSSVIFVWFGLKVKYEEDISKLLPQTDESSDKGLAFGSLKVKDKIFIQMQAAYSIDIYALMDACDEFFDSLKQADSATLYIDNELYRIDDDLAVMGLDFAMAHVPSFVDTSCYPLFDEALTPEAAKVSMAEDYDLVLNDETGSATTMVSTDPLVLRKAVAAKIGLSGGGLGGFTVIDKHLFCRDSTVELGFISPDFTSFDSGAGSALTDLIQKEISQFEASHPGISVLYHGAPVRSAFNSKQIKSDLLVTIGLSFLVIIIFLCFSFKSLSLLPFMALPVAYGTFFALSCIFWAKGGMSLMALGIGAIVLGVALSYCLHVLAHYKYVGGAVQMLKDESTPVCLGCLTTIGAFLGLLFTKSDLLRDFGLFATLSLVGSTLFALIVLPHFLEARSRRKEDRKNEKVFAFIDRMNAYPLDRKPWLLVSITVLCVVCIFFSGKVGFDSDLKNIGYNNPKVLESERLYAQKNYNGNAQMYYAATGKTLDEALTANDKILAVVDSLSKAGVVKQYSSAVSALFPTLAEQNGRIDAWNAYWTDAKVSQVRKTIGDASKTVGLSPETFEPFFQMVGATYAPASLYDAGVLPEGLLSNFIEQSSEGSFLVFTPVQMPDSLKSEVNDAVAAVPHAVVVDPFYYMNDMVKLIHDDFNLVLWISSLFVFLVLLVSFRNLWSSLLAFMPMCLSWFVVEGLMAIFGLKFNLINIVVSTFIFGIGVDYSIFVMEGLLAQARGGSDKLLIYHKSAIFFSAFVLLVVVLSLMFASHPAIQSIGLSTFIGMTSTILITYTLQPFLFRQMMKVGFFRRSFGVKD